MKTNPADIIDDPKASLMQVDPVDMKLAVVNDARKALEAGYVTQSTAFICGEQMQISPELATAGWLRVCEELDWQVRNPNFLQPVPNVWRVIEELARRWVLRCS